MPSTAFVAWETTRARNLDEIESIRTTIRGHATSKQSAIQHLNRAYAMLLSAEFQGFCKDLHRECVDHILKFVPELVRDIVRQQFFTSRLLDRGNPNPGNIGADFNRLGLSLIELATQTEGRVGGWRHSLERLNEWRNAIAHEDFAKVRRRGTIQLGIVQVREYRTACGKLAELFDRILGEHLETVTGTKCW